MDIALLDNAATAANKASLFRETVGYSVIESYVNGVTELWRDQRRSKTNPNPHVVLRGKGLTDLLTAVRQADWDRRRAEHVDRALFTVVDGYDPPKMKEAIAWCWQEGSRARTLRADGGGFSFRSVSAFFLLHHVTD